MKGEKRDGRRRREKEMVERERGGFKRDGK